MLFTLDDSGVDFLRIRLSFSQIFLLFMECIIFFTDILDGSRSLCRLTFDCLAISLRVDQQAFGVLFKIVPQDSRKSMLKL